MATETRIKRVTKEDLAKTLDTLGENVKGHHFARMNSDNADYTKVKIYDENATDPYDGVMIKRIKNDDMQKIILTYKDLTNDEEIVKEYDCDFTYEPKEEDTSDDTPAETPSDDSEGGSDDTTPDSEGGSDNTEGGAE